MKWRRAFVGVTSSVLAVLVTESTASAQATLQAPPAGSVTQELTGPTTAGARRAPAVTSSPKRNLLALDVLARSGLVGVAYERDLSTRVGIGIGGGTGWDVIEEQGVSGLIPLYVSWSPVGRTHRLYVAAGFALVHVPASYRNYAVGWEPRIGWSAYGTGGIGYEHRGPNKVWRLTLNVWYQPSGIPGGYLNARERGIFVMPALSIAKRF